MIIKEVPRPHLKDLFAWLPSSSKQQFRKSKPEVLSGVKIVGSGKGAITLILKYLKDQGVLTDKLDEVIVPQWIGYWIYNQIQSFAFPAKRFSERTKAIFVYHQYGFPQDMNKILKFARDKKLVVIEDCAHALDSYYQGRKLGSMGDFTVYSFSKWFSCFALGGVKSKFVDFFDYTEKSVAKTPFGLTLIKDSAKFLYDLSNFSKNKFFKKYANLFLNMSYALYGDALRASRLAEDLLKRKIEDEVKIRQKRYRYFLSQTRNLGICDHLEKEGITPYVIPIHCPELKND